MTKIRTLLFLVLCWWSATGVVQAQKSAHLNFGSIVAIHPDVKIAEENLKKYQEEQIAIFEQKATDFQQRATDLMNKAQNGELPPIKQLEQEDQLRIEQNELKNLEGEIQARVAAKRDELLNPIVTKVNEAIKQVAQENGYEMVFDTSIFNAVLFAEDSDDILLLVKNKLGI